MESHMEKKTLGVTTACYVGFTLEDALRGISEAGFPCVEIVAANGIPGAEHIQPNSITDKEIVSLKRKVADANLQLISLAGYSDLTKPESVAYTKKCLDVAEKLGVKVITTGCGRDASKEAVNQFYENMEELGEYALDKGVTIGVETHGGITPTGKHVSEAIRKIDSKAVRINYDTGNVIYFGGAKPEEDLKYALEYLVHLHLKDNIGGQGSYNFPPLGQGNVDFDSIFEILQENHYSGGFSVEIEYQRSTQKTIELIDQGLASSFNFLDDLFTRKS